MDYRLKFIYRITLLTAIILTLAKTWSTRDRKDFGSEPDPHVEKLLHDVLINLSALHSRNPYVELTPDNLIKRVCTISCCLVIIKNRCAPIRMNAVSILFCIEK